jgi:hypothetical protein
MQDIQAKIDKFKKFFAKKELGILLFYDSSDMQSLREDFAQQRANSNTDFLTSGQNNLYKFIPLKILKATPLFEKEISKVPLEQTKVINDNIRVKPKRVSIQVLLNDYTGTLLIGQLGSFLKKPEVRSVLGLLDFLIEDSYFCDVITLTRKFTNMQLIKYDYEEGINNKDKYLIVNLEFQEIMMFEVKKEGDVGKANVSTVNMEDMGSDFMKMVKRFARW